MFDFKKDKQNDAKKIVEIIERELQAYRDAKSHWLSELKKADEPHEARACISLYEQCSTKISVCESLLHQIKNLDRT